MLEKGRRPGVLGTGRFSIFLLFMCHSKSDPVDLAIYTGVAKIVLGFRPWHI
jgi:hypothetical protein